MQLLGHLHTRGEVKDGWCKEEQKLGDLRECARSVNESLRHARPDKPKPVAYVLTADGQYWEPERVNPWPINNR